jgi:hypothetical protein
MQISADSHLTKKLMQKTSLIIFFCFTLISSFGQRHKTVDIVKKADSLIISIVGKDVFNKHYQLDTAFKIDPVQLTYDKEQEIKHISLTSKTTRRFKFISVNYIFYIKKYEQPTVLTRIILDKDLNPKYPVDTFFIPQFILKKTKDNFLSKDQALNVAKSKFKKQGLKIESRIYYDPQRKGYVWEITNVLEEFTGGNRSVEFIKIDPITGETIEILNALQGQLH